MSLTSSTPTAPAKRSISNAQQVSTFRQPGDNGKVIMDNSTFFKTLGTIIGLYAVAVMLMAGMIVAIVAVFHG
ncbi:hypothetical protein [Pectobacterium versatile]|uniref:hypothetical protein n=1 Tax=Pectobacterium versatile TaxID=2488639 RepID=UPI001B36AA63|nr:hypothetical protein [Pectobacterium versatile]MBQ4778125.1 hypothetical protein [Pectobacterium versatile]